jgi:hypothetical protein
LPISDSLRGTTRIIELRSARTAKEELEDPVDPVEPVEEELEVLERPVAAVGDVAELEPVDELLDVERVVPVADTSSPTWPESEAIVPVAGAYSLVFATACSSLCAVRASLLTAARAEAMFASRVAVLIVDVVEEDVDFVSLDALVSPDALRVSPAVLVAGWVVVVVPVRVAGVVVVGMVLVVVGVVEVGVPCPPAGVVVVGEYEASPAVAEPVEPVEPVAAAELEPCPVDPSPSVSSCLARVASADCSAAFDCSSVTSALCGSSVAISCPWTTRWPWVT